MLESLYDEQNVLKSRGGGHFLTRRVTLSHDICSVSFDIVTEILYYYIMLLLLLLLQVYLYLDYTLPTNISCYISLLLLLLLLQVYLYLDYKHLLLYFSNVSVNISCHNNLT